MRERIIFGAGQAGQFLYRLLQRGGKQVIAFADHNPALWGSQREEVPVCSPEQAVRSNPQEIYLAVVNAEAQKEMERELRELGYQGQIIPLSELRSRFQIRLATCRMLAQEIRRRDVPGAIGELGVYQGEFAEELNRLFPERKLYLFDTFCGFDPRDIGREDGVRAQAGQFADTTEAAVRKRMPFPEQVVIRKGYFPESLQGAELPDCFALVSLDVDLYRPTAAGLSWFYDRLSPGGYLILDDYNSPQFPGAGQAIREFCRERGLAVVPLCDLHGTAVLAKAGGGQ